MAKHELALLLGKTVSEIDELSYEELTHWYAYLEKRPPGWREDNRAAVVAMSFGGSDKVKPEDLFPSLKALKKESSQEKSFASKFLERFSNVVTDKERLSSHA